MDKITLDRDVFKALASDTRLDILKKLDARQKTVTELAKELELNKSTVLEHLEKLEAVGLIQKVEQDVERKWVYWQLTWTGRRLLHPEQVQVALLLSTAGGALASAIAAVWLWMRSGTAEAPVESDLGPRTMLAPESPPPAPEPTLDPLWLGVAIGFALLALLAVAWAVRVHLKARAQAPRLP
ncbi:MAG TPA: winged helix-turn-helix domain-containing protein, partial [Candidatus Thermoplasmatota archaeon]|nr:winged helix-turn-helix domain-containing protein [Candidatus Thermoplasmatota archaeon]